MGFSDLLCKRAFLLCFLCFGRINLKISLNTDCFYWCPFKISNDWTRGRANVLQTRYYPLQLLTPDQTSQRIALCNNTRWPYLKISKHKFWLVQCSLERCCRITRNTRNSQNHKAPCVRRHAKLWTYIYLRVPCQYAP